MSRVFDRTNSYWLLESSAQPTIGIEVDDMVQHFRQLSAGHPRFLAALDGSSEEFFIGGDDERELEANTRLLREKLACDFDVGSPRASFRETITTEVLVDYTHLKTHGGVRQFARVKLNFEPSNDKMSFEFVNDCAFETIPYKYIPTIEQGLQRSRSVGPIAGFPIQGLNVALVGGACRTDESSVIAFETAARAAFREAFEKADPALLEPVAKTIVTTPNARVGDVLGELNNRRAEISDSARSAGSTAIPAFIPASKLLGFTTALADLTEG